MAPKRSPHGGRPSQNRAAESVSEDEVARERLLSHSDDEHSSSPHTHTHTRGQHRRQARHYEDEEEEHYNDDEDSHSHTHTAASSHNSPTQHTQHLVVTHTGSLDRSQLSRTEGYLHKKGGAVNARGGFRNWKRRWFSLESVSFLGIEGFELRYFDRPGGTLKGTVNLNDVELREESRSSHNKRIQHEFQLVLQNGGVLQLSSESEEEKNEWMQTIHAVTLYLRKMTTYRASPHKSAVMLLDGYDPLCEDDEHSFAKGEEIAQNCQAFGPGLFGSEAGVPTQFVVQIHDLLGQAVRRGGMPLTACIQDLPLREKRFYVAVLEGEDGLYYAQYTLSTAGEYELSVCLNDEHHIFGSPFAPLRVFPTHTRAAHCSLHGEALQCVYVNRPSSFTITAKDAFFNAKNRGGDPFEVSLLGPARLLSLEDNNDGSYTCTVEGLLPPSNGTRKDNNAITTQGASLQVHVTLYGKAVAGSPFQPLLTDTQTQAQTHTQAHALSVSPSVGSLSSQSHTLQQSNNLSLAHSLSVSAMPTLPQTHTQPQAHSQSARESHTERDRDAPLTAAELSVSLSPRTPTPTQSLTQSRTQPARSQAANVPPPHTQPSNAQNAERSRAPTQPQAQTQAQTITPTQSTQSQAQSGPLSRLERSRQRALLAKSLAENKTRPQAQPHSSTTQQPLPHTDSVPFTQTQAPETEREILAQTHTQTLAQTQSAPTQRDLQREISRPPATQPRRTYTATQGAPPNAEPSLSLDWLGLSQNAPTQQAQQTQRPGSKLSALAQRNAALLQAKKNGVPVSAQMNVDNPSAQTRGAFLAELTAQLHNGLGRWSLAISGQVSTGPFEAQVWEQTNRALENNALVSRLLTNIDTLSAVFNVFSERVQTLSVLRMLTTHSNGGIFRCLELYSVVPQALSRPEVKTLFTLLTNAQRAQRTPASAIGNGTGLDLAFFLKALVLFSVFACNKSLSGGATATLTAVEQQLMRWGFTDAERLVEVRRVLGIA